MNLPARIFDLHTHLFNARYIPLASIIANAMNKDESILANYIAKLLEALTGSSYPDSESVMVHSFTDEDALDEYRLEQIWEITRFELLVATGSLDAMNMGVSILQNRPFADSAFDSLRSSELMSIIKDLSEIDYTAEGWTGRLPAFYSPVVPFKNLGKTLLVGGLFDWAKSVVKKALRVVNSLMSPNAWGKAENYIEFFLTMLKSEEKMLAKVFKGYGHDLPQLQISHYMMDMQMAYAGHKSPYYPFYPSQIKRMQELQRASPACVFGFSAFDPQREDCIAIAEYSLSKGLLGFKFYPAMGYKPIGNITEIQARIDAFFDFCVLKDVAVFAHCTPQGFQTRHKLGANAHPKYWRSVLENQRWGTLRLCLGHAGGGRMRNGDLESPGWMAESDEEWLEEDNFARIVTELCTTYPNVYCEVGYITSLFENTNPEVFVANIERARTKANEEGRHYELLDKMAYGSDWHMSKMVGNTRKYLEIFLKIMNREAYKSYLERFFWQNAYRFLKLPS
ncbi:MAG: amidohydrolase family protein [Pseudomonadota bacterium]